MLALVMRSEEQYVIARDINRPVFREGLKTFNLRNYTNSVVNAPTKPESSDAPSYEIYLDSQQAGDIPDVNFVTPKRTTMDEQLEAMVAFNRRLTITDLGWTREQAAVVRGLFSAIAEDWDDPAMDVYDDL